MYYKNKIVKYRKLTIYLLILQIIFDAYVLDLINEILASTIPSHTMKNLFESSVHRCYQPSLYTMYTII